MTLGVYTKQNGTNEIFWESGVSWERVSKVLVDYFNQVDWREDEQDDTIYRGYIRGEKNPVLMAQVW